MLNTLKLLRFLNHKKLKELIDNGLPSKLKNANQMFIRKFVWQRVIKGSDKLIVEIEEL
jgi:hypothetical protein